MKDNYKKIKFLIYFAEAVLLFVLQQNSFLVPEIFGGKPTLLIPLLISISMFQTEGVSTIFGMIIGILLDIGVGHIIGFYAILLPLIAYALSYISGRFLKINFLSYSIYCFIVVILLQLMHFVVFYLIHGYGGYSYVLIQHYLSRTIYTILLSPIIYLFNRSVEFRIREND